MKTSAARLTIVSGLTLAFFLSPHILFVPSSSSIVILLTYAYWWHLSNEIFCSENSKYDRIPQEFLINELELNLFSDKIFRVVALFVSALADRHHSFDVIGVLQLVFFFDRITFDHRALESSWPNIFSDIIFADAFFSGIF